MNPIAKLVSETMKKKDVSRIGLVQMLGYRNTNKGLRRIDALLQSGSGNKELLAKIAEALGIEREKMTKALTETHELIRQQREAYERNRFKPHIYVQHSLSRPRSITIVGCLGVGRFKFISVPLEIIALPLQQQIEPISALIKQHYREKEGKCPMFGEIIGYIYRHSFDEGMGFSAQGELINANLKRQDGEWSPQTTLVIGGKQVTGGLFKDMKVKES